MHSYFARQPLFSTIAGNVYLRLLSASFLIAITSTMVSLLLINNLVDQAHSANSNAMIHEVQSSMQTQAQNVGQDISKQLQLISNTTEELANYAGYLLDNPKGIFSGGLYNQATTLIHDQDHGQWYNPITEPDSLFLPNTIQALTPGIINQINILTYLDPLFKAHYDQDQYPTSIGTILGVTRYYAPPANSLDNADLGHLVAPNFDVTARPWFTGATEQNDPEQKPAFTSLYLDATGKGLVITSSAPVYTSNGTFAGVVARDVTLSHLLSMLPSSVGQNGYAFLVEQDGNIISMPPQGQLDFNVQLTAPPQGQVVLNVPLDQKVRAATQLKDALAHQPQGLLRFSLGGNPKYLAFDQVAGIPWDVVLVFPTSEVLASLDGLENQLSQQNFLATLLSIGLLVLLMLLAAYVAWDLRRKIIRPISALVESARHLAGGQSLDRDPQMSASQEWMVQRTDEVGQLARSLETLDRYLEETSQLAEQVAQGNFQVMVHPSSSKDRLGIALERMMDYLRGRTV